MSDARLPLQFDVVSVQSQVVYGRVGNNVAIPTLTALGLSTAAVPTVLLSNTPHYPTNHGGRLPLEWFGGYLRDLSARGALQELRAILVGYLGAPDQAAALADWARPFLTERADLRIVVDPVLGDHDHGIYVDPGMVEAYRQHLLPLAHGLTPNGFELAQLTGRTVDDLASVVAAARTLLTGPTRWIAVTSAAPATWPTCEMQIVLVTRTRAQVLTHPRVDVSPKGTGDLFAATLTGHLLHGASLEDAAADACEHVVQALRHTESAQSAELLLPVPSSNPNHIPTPHPDSRHPNQGRKTCTTGL